MTRAGARKVTRVEQALRRMFAGAYGADRGLEPPILAQPIQGDPITLEELLRVARPTRGEIPVLLAEDPDVPTRGVLVVGLSRLPDLIAHYVAASPVLMSHKIKRAYARRHGLDLRLIAPDDPDPVEDRHFDEEGFDF